MRFLFSITLTLVVVGAHSQLLVPTAPLPKVFLIGEHEESYLALSKEHPVLFLTVYKNDIDLAYKAWSKCLLDIEDLSTTLNFDLKGVKLWLNVYFNKDGTIAYLSYYPKPNSRNVPHEHLTAFFKNFVRDYQLPVTFEKGFQHSTSASFPSLVSRDAELAKRN